MAEKEAKEAAAGQSEEEHELSFTYYKSNHFRVIHADGAWGGITPRGNIHISLYNERAAIPDTSTVVVSEKTRQAIKPEEFSSKSKYVREVETDVIVDLATAISIRDWLSRRINELEGLLQGVQEKAGEVHEQATEQGK